MELWKGAWYLAKHELARDRWKSLFSILFIGYLLLFTVPLLNDVIDGDKERALYWAADFIYLTLMPCMGFILNQTMMRYWKDNSYTKKLAYWRTLPISSKQIALGRIMQLAIVLFATQFLFFIAQFILVRNMGADISTLHFALYGLFWFGYSLTMAIAYVYWEVGHSGKIYFLFNMAYIFVLLVFSLGLTVLMHGNIVVVSLQAITNGHWWIALATIAISVAAIFIGVNRIENRLEKRSYSA
ncbi:hypothetical protein [Paenibacillus sp. PL91]|uniref:hypothetical protein n=1 Tax=Paenibacillus sp. PL91 TaxID=2729538 RepID=UPI00145D6BD3|nr:hypothetical protein [Paenibacillus sp. PL91]MBC9202176.1 hypothetical protein [Paenibacillus sp. PL91]